MFMIRSLLVKQITVVSSLLWTMGPALGSSVVPSHEKKSVETLKGPKKPKGIESITKVASVDLSKEFTSPEGRSLRARRITINPGGVVPVHRHQGRPGMAYILQGEIIEHRDGKEILRKAGDHSIENTGVIHWWENRSKADVVALVIDILEDKKKHSH